MQKVKLAKHISDDGYFIFKESLVGMEFWIDVNTYKVAHYRRAGTGEMFHELVVKARDESKEVMVPVSMLDYTNEFQVTG